MLRIAPQNDSSSWLVRLPGFLQNGPLPERGGLYDNFIAQPTSNCQSKLKRGIANPFT